MAAAWLEVGRSNVVRFHPRSFRGALAGRSESCLEVSKARASVIGFVVAYIQHQLDSRGAWPCGRRVTLGAGVRDHSVSLSA